MSRAPDGKLARYNAKRDFARTPEPVGEEARSGRSIFIVQKHAASRLHWDFRLEHEGVLWSWAVTRGPSADPKDKRLAVRTEDHPLSYATFEGTIPKGEYGGGTVMLWDRGRWEPAPAKDPGRTMAEGHLHFTLHGERMRGEWILVRLKPRSGERGENWLLRKVADAHAGGDLAAEHMTSVATGRSMEAIAGGEAAAATVVEADGNGARPPAFRAPMLATLSDSVPTGRGWLHEVKFDGYRLLVAVTDGRVEAWTRNGNRFEPPSLAPVAAELTRLGLGRVLLDGEVCALDGQGRPDFARLKSSLKDGSAPLDLFLFDLIEADGEVLTGLPLTERKARLQALLKGARPPVHFTDHVVGEGERVLSALCGAGYEGILSKRCDSRYALGRRSKSWLKIKCGARQEFVIGGWTPSGKGRPFASLLLGYHEDGRFLYSGRVGTGFDTATMAALAGRMAAIEVNEPAYAALPREVRRGARFVRPQLVAEVAFTEWTPDGHLRHPSFIGLREDKPAAGVVRERAADVAAATPAPAHAPAPAAGPKREPKPSPPRAGPDRWHGIVLTNPDRVLFPEGSITKAELADYYATVAGLILPEIRGRPLSLVRCPQGRARQCFFQKHDSGGFDASVRQIDLHEVTSEGRDRQPYLYVEDARALIALVQMGTLELHIWGSRVPREETPDRLVIDLDPDEGLGFAEVVRAARDMRARLAALGLKSWPMLTGGKGVHVVVPVTPGPGWAETKAWCAAFARAAAAEAPGRYTATLSKKARAGRIFIDYLRNGRGSTAIAPYSTRARPGAPVAAPVAWEELDGFASGGAFTLKDAARLLERARVLKGWGKAKQKLP